MVSEGAQNAFFPSSRGKLTKGVAGQSFHHSSCPSSHEVRGCRSRLFPTWALDIAYRHCEEENTGNNRKKEERVFGVSIAADTKEGKCELKLSRRIWKAWAVFGHDHIGMRSRTRGEEGHKKVESI